MKNEYKCICGNDEPCIEGCMTYEVFSQVPDEIENEHLKTKKHGKSIFKIK